MALKNPGNIDAAVSLTKEQFRYGFGNGISEDESDELFDKWAIPSPGRPPIPGGQRQLQPAGADEGRHQERGPRTAAAHHGRQGPHRPEAFSKSTYKQYQHLESTTELTEFADRGHSLTIDHGWREIADSVLSCLKGKGDLRRVAVAQA